MLPGAGRARNSWSAGVPPATYGARASRPQLTERGRPARKNKCGQDARAPQSKRPQHRHSEKPRERGLRFAAGSKPRPGVKRRAEDRLRRRRPVNGPLDWPIPERGHGKKPPPWALAKESAPMPPQVEGPPTGVGIGRLPNAARGRDQKVVHVYILAEIPQFLEKPWMTLYTTKQHARAAHMLRTKRLTKTRRLA